MTDHPAAQSERGRELSATLSSLTPAHFMCPSPYKIGDIIEVEQTVWPKWWQFWRKPEKVLQKYEVKSVYP